MTRYEKEIEKSRIARERAIKESDTHLKEFLAKAAYGHKLNAAARLTIEEAEQEC